MDIKPFYIDDSQIHSRRRAKAASLLRHSRRRAKAAMATARSESYGG